PYALQGRRIVFTDWYYIQPGDLDWVDKEGKSVYVDGNSGLTEARHVGINAPRGIRIEARKPSVIGPFENMPYRTILKDGAVFKGWTSTEYYESPDGMAWEKKANLALDALHEDGVLHVFIDPAGAPEERFKAVWVGHITRKEFDTFRAKRPDGWEPRALFLSGEKDAVSCLRGSVSPDGIRWTTLPEPLVVEYSDTLNTAYYDATLRKYVIYTRYWSIGPRAESLPPDIRNSWTGFGRRAIGRTESPDFRAFPPSEMILEPSPNMLPSEALYTNCRTTVPGNPDQHLMFPAVWNASIDDTTRIVMASSHDGKVWHWTPGGDLLGTAPFGAWNGGCIWANPNLLELPNGDWALPYLAHNVPHKYPRGQRVGGMGYAVWPKGRLAALVAEDEGEFTLIPLMPPGRAIAINATTRRTGWIKIEVAGVDGRTFEDCIPVVGDQPSARIKWGDASDLGVGENQPVTLRIRMHQAELYGLGFGD
ncbi:MAG: hypothetical protein WC655_03975, partial [Candidatus Hydrogenedentales bacterium]